MTRYTRRDALRTGAVAVAFSTAGCVQQVARVSQNSARVGKQTIPGLDQTKGRTIESGSASFPITGATVGRSNTLPDREGPADGVRKGWRFTPSHDRISQPVVANGTLAFVGGDYDEEMKVEDGELYALNPDSGELRWHYSGATPGTAEPFIRDGFVYGGPVGVPIDAGQNGEHLTHESPDPDRRPDTWEPDNHLSDPRSPVPSSNTLIFARDIGVTAVDTTGEVRWRANGEDYFEDKPETIGDPALAGDYVCYLDTHDNHLVTYDTTEEQFSIQPLDAPPLGTPAAVGATVYARCELEGEGGTLQGFDIAADERVLERDFEGAAVATNPAVADNFVVVGLTDGRIVAPRPNRIDNMWTTEVSGRPTGLTRTATTVYVSVADNRNDRGSLVAIDVESGKKQWSFTIENQLVTAPAVTDTAIFVGDTTGAVHGLEEV